MNILVTGGAGFIGSNLISSLANKHDISVIDNFHLGKRENLKPFINKIKLIKEACEQLDGKKFQDLDAIFHFGIYSSSPFYKKNPKLCSKSLEGMLSILELARKKNAKLIYATSSSIYNGHKPPHHEKLEPKVTDFYTEARIAMERLAKLYHKLYGLKPTGLRLFSIYGPGERHKGRYANVLTQMLLNDKFTIYGDGTQTRDFTYVSDAVEAFKKALTYNDSGIFNVGTGKETSFNKLARLIKKIKPLKISYKSNPIRNYVKRTQADTFLAKHELGFEAKIKLKEGIKLTSEHYL